MKASPPPTLKGAHCTFPSYQEESFNLANNLLLILLQIYCCLGALAIADSLHHVNADMLGWWLCERQLPSGGLNGELKRIAVRITVKTLCYESPHNTLINP